MVTPATTKTDESVVTNPLEDDLFLCAL